MRQLLLLSCLALLPASVLGAAAPERDPYGAALAAAAKIKQNAPGTLRELRRMPVEFAGVTKVIGYADEVGARDFAAPDASAALERKKSCWTAHARALGARLAEIAVDEAARRQMVQRRAGTFGDSLTYARQDLLLGAEKAAVIASLDRVDAVLADIAADEKGQDAGQALIERKIVLFERLAR